MSRIRGKDTFPEMVVRRVRFIRPDIVLPKYKTVIFVHGCFWHRHRGCRNCATPTNVPGKSTKGLYNISGHGECRLYNKARTVLRRFAGASLSLSLQIPSAGRADNRGLDNLLRA